MYPINDKNGNIFEYMCQIKDITDKVNLENKLKTQAKIDSLTGLANRQTFLEEGEILLKESYRSGSDISLFYLDLDGFKQVNDTYGHNIGDLILKEVSDRLIECIRDTDLVARIGGDEFVMIFPYSTIKGSAETAERIYDEISKPYLDMGNILSTSIGISRPAGRRKNLEDLLKEADEAMYVAKESSDKKYFFYEKICIL